MKVLTSTLNYNEVRAYWKNNRILVESELSDCRCYTSGRHRGTYGMLDGKIIELWENNSGFAGLLEVIFVFDSYSEYIKYDHFPYALNNEVGLGGR